MPANLLTAAGAVTLVNLPFGYWRAGVRKLSAPWFVAVHAPVLLAVLIRLGLHVPLAWRTLPVMVAAFALGQWLGGRIRRRHVS